jgi:hypothetical protein
MRNLLIAFLLFIFSLQGAVAAIGDEIAATGQADCGYARVLDSASLDADDGADEATVSSTIEELSDYVPLDLPVSQARYPVPLPPLPHAAFRSIDLPTIKPPPRG